MLRTARSNFSCRPKAGTITVIGIGFIKVRFFLQSLGGTTWCREAVTMRGCVTPRCAAWDSLAVTIEIFADDVYYPVNQK